MVSCHNTPDNQAKHRPTLWTRTAKIRLTVVSLCEPGTIHVLCTW